MTHIEQIKPVLTRQLRRDVLYPDKQLHEVQIDEDSDGYHFAAFADNKIIAVVSLFTKGDGDWQFRKFAVDAAYQGKGIGTELLTYIIAFTRAEGAARLWCNARVSALGFYYRHGFADTGEIFVTNGIEYHIIERRLS